jgi:8-oxo-dGTP pyrophosphatase MutT (NUDIX family)
MTLSAEALRDALDHALPGGTAHAAMVPDGRPRHGFSARSAATRHSAVLIALIPDLTDPDVPDLSFPLIQRTDDGGPHALQIALPGGAAEGRDADIIATALREAREEIALPTESFSILGCLSDLYIDVSDYLITPVVAWFAGADADEEVWRHLRPQPGEVERILRGTIRTLTSTRDVRGINVRGLRLDAPSYLVENEIVWGATGMILAEILAVIEAIPATRRTT